MQVFIPFPDVDKSLDCLCMKRLGKQRLEARTLIYFIENQIWTKWRTQSRMYQPWVGFLKHYYNRSLIAFKQRGGENRVLVPYEMGTFDYPDWWGDEQLHESHRRNLMRKALTDRTLELLVRLNNHGLSPFNTEPLNGYIWK